MSHKLFTLFTIITSISSSALAIDLTKEEDRNSYALGFITGEHCKNQISAGTKINPDIFIQSFKDSLANKSQLDKTEIIKILYSMRQQQELTKTSSNQANDTNLSQNSSSDPNINVAAPLQNIIPQINDGKIPSTTTTKESMPTSSNNGSLQIEPGTAQPPKELNSSNQAQKSAYLSPRLHKYAAKKNLKLIGKSKFSHNKHHGAKIKSQNLTQKKDLDKSKKI